MCISLYVKFTSIKNEKEYISLRKANRLPKNLNLWRCLNIYILLSQQTLLHYVSDTPTRKINNSIFSALQLQSQVQYIKSQATVSSSFFSSICRCRSQVFFQLLKEWTFFTECLNFAFQLIQALSPKARTINAFQPPCLVYNVWWKRQIGSYQPFSGEVKLRQPQYIIPPYLFCHVVT